MNRYLNKDQTLDLIEKIKGSSFEYDYNATRHQVVVRDNAGNEQLTLRLPINISGLTTPHRPVHYIIALIQSGSSALGYFEDDLNLDHKVYNAYMVRKKQGKSQIKYLKTKGKSRAGSRVRLNNSTLFFENINSRLQHYFENHRIDRIALSCSKILIPYLFNAKVPCPFEKTDSRIMKIPRHIHTPNFTVLTDVQRFLLKGELTQVNDDFMQQLVR